MREFLRRCNRLLRRYPGRFYSHCMLRYRQGRFYYTSFCRCRKWLGVPRAFEIAVCDPLRIRRKFRVTLRGVSLWIRANWPMH
jgi:hypothetical protein